MVLSRRNVLIGLGGIVGGGGLLMSTGAFSTASAERSVEVSTAGDDSAFLTITGNSSYVTDDSGDTLTIDLGGPEDEGFNLNAITTLQDIVEITNNSADEQSTTVGVSTEGASNQPTGSGEASLLLQNGDDENEAVVTFYVGKSDENAIADGGSTEAVGSGDSVYLDVEIDTTDDTLDDPGASTGDLTIVAE